MQNINPLINNTNIYVPKSKPKEQSFGNSYVQNYAPMPVYTQVPYGIHQRNYVKLGVDKLPNGQELHLYQLSNGQKVEILSSDGNSSIMTKVGVGGLDEKDFPKGISHFVEHSMFHSSKNYSDIEHECDLISTMSNASTSNSETKYYMNLASQELDDLKKAIDIQADMLLNPEFSKIEKEKKVVKAEVEDGLNDEIAKIDSYMIKQLLNAPLSANVDIAGSVESVDSITLDDLKRFHQKYYQPNNFNTVLVTKHNPDDVIKLVADSFVSKSPKNQTQVQTPKLQISNEAKRVDLVSQNSAAGRCEFVFTYQNDNSFFEESKISSLAKLLDMRYDIQLVQMPLHDNTVQIYLNAGNLKDSSVEEKYQFLSQMFYEVMVNPPTTKEMEEIKKSLKADAETAFNSGNVSAMTSVLSSFNGQGYVSSKTQMQNIDNLSSNDVVDALKYLDLSKAFAGVLHPRGTNIDDVKTKHSEFKPLANPIFISKNMVEQNYQISETTEQMTGRKIHSTILNNGSRLLFLDSNDEECKIDWMLNCEQNYMSNPALKYILANMQNKNCESVHAIFSLQDSVNFISECKLDEIESKASLMKRFSNLSFTQKDFDEAKRKTLEDLEYQQSTYDDDLVEFMHGKKYTNDIGYIKSQVENMTLEQLVQDFNGIIANATSTIVVRAPFSKNPQLMNQVANNFDSSNFVFKPHVKSGVVANGGVFSNFIRIDNARQNTILQQYDFPLSGNPKDEYTFKVLAKVLSHMNFDLIREKEGLAYSSSANFESRNYIGNISFETDSSCSNKGDIAKILESYNSNVSKVLNGQITDDELTFAKNKLKGSVISVFETDENTVPWLLCSGEKQGTIESIDKIKDIIDSITIEDLQRAANYAFKNKPRYFSSLTQQTYDANKEYLQNLGEPELRLNQ